MRNYSITLVLRTSLNDAGKKKILDTVKDYVKDAKFSKDEVLGEKQLAYPIKRETSGFYQGLLFQMEAGLPQDLDKRLAAHDEILRFLIIRSLDTREQATEKKETPEKKTVKKTAKAKN